MLSLDWHGLGVRMKAFVRRPPPLVFVFVLLVLFELEESVQPVPTIRLLEDAICNQEYRDRHILGGVEEPMCKTPPIQAKLARIRGLSSFFDSLPAIISGPFFGYIADRRGRRLAFALAVTGTLCAMGWIYLVCLLWDRVPVEIVWLASVFRLIGGGTFLPTALCLTMSSDLSTESERGKNFYRVYSAVLVTDVIGPLIAYSTLKHSLWLPFLVCTVSLGLTYVVVIFMSETRPKASEAHVNNSALEMVGFTSYLKFLKDWRILVGVIVVFLAQFRYRIVDILPPYTSVRFNIQLGQTATLLSMASSVNVPIFLYVLPTASAYLEKHGWSSQSVNIHIARASAALLTLGTAVLAAAPALWMVVLALVIHVAGWGVRLSTLAVVTGFVDETKDTAKLYTLMATTDALAYMVGNPLIQIVWSRALAIGDGMIVLPFIILAIIFLCTFITTCLLQESPQSEVQTEGNDGFNLEQEPLLDSEQAEEAVEESLARAAAKRNRSPNRSW